MAARALYWLGPPQIKVSGRHVKLETRKVTALLAFLSVEGRPYSRERLAAMFWPEYDSTRAPANLRRVLASLQKTLGKGWLKTDPDTLEFCSDEDTRVDCRDFADGIESFFKRLDTAGSGENIGNSERLQKILSLHRGQFLEGFNLKDSPEFDSWQIYKREEYQRLACRALDFLVEYYSANGKWDEAVKAAQRLLALDNLNENVHRNLMMLFARTGKRNAAIQQYKNCRRLLREELDMEPDEQTEKLAERIRLRQIKLAEPEHPANHQLQTSEKLSEIGGIQPTKLFPPRIRSKLVWRPRLHALLHEGLTRRLTLISAPAGFGKTTLVSEWVRNCKIPAAWVSLEQSDNEPARLFSAVAAALHRLHADVAGEALLMLRSMQPPGITKVIESMTHDMQRESYQCLLVLDDFHLIQNRETQGLISQLLEHMPEVFHLFISTRVDPGLPLAKLRAGDQLVEVRSGDLRFSKDETSAFLFEVMGLDLEEKDIEILEERTEGWAAGLQMAGISLQRRSDRPRFVADFGGSHRYIMDYLIGEVLEGQSETIRKFLLTTSILERFCGDLCDELLQDTGSQGILEELDRNNIFLVALDDNRVWYRYHHLFSELLRHRLSITGKTEAVADLHLRAGRWYEKTSDIGAAMYHYLKCRNYPEALRVINENLQEILKQGGLGMLRAWMMEIPDDAVDEDPRGNIDLGIICTFSGMTEEAERYFTRADRLVDNSGTAEHVESMRILRGQTEAMRAFIADVGGCTDRALHFAHKAEELLPDEQVMTRSIVPFILCRIYRHRGELNRAESYVKRQFQLALQADNTWSLSGAVHEMVWLCRLKGRLHEADETLKKYDRMFARTENKGPIAKTIAARGELERERGNLEAASVLVDNALHAAEGWGLPSDICFCLHNRIRVELSAGRPEEARKALNRIDEITRTSRVHTSILPLYEAERARIFLALGMVSEAMGRLDSYRLPDEGEIINREIIGIARARVLNAADRHEEAGKILDRLASEAEKGGRRGRLLQILVLRAATPEGADTADRALLHALKIAEPEGYVRVFLDEGEAVIAELSGLSKKHGHLPNRTAEYVRFLLSFVKG